MAATTYFRDRGVVVMASQNFDGDWITRVLHKFGYGAARGSTSRGGARALARLRKDMRGGASTAFTVDGPRGPARVVQPGAVWLASTTGHPILPFHIEASKFWTVRSWDRHQVPKPGSTVAIVTGEPMRVVRGDELHLARQVEIEPDDASAFAKGRAIIDKSIRADVAPGMPAVELSELFVHKHSRREARSGSLIECCCPFETSDEWRRVDETNARKSRKIARFSGTRACG
jgi:hypothetical protein